MCVQLFAKRRKKIATLAKDDIDVCDMEDEFREYQTLSVDVNRYKVQSQGKHRVFVHSNDFKKDFHFSLCYYMIMMDSAHKQNLLPDMATKVYNPKTGKVKSDVSGMFTTMFDKMSKVVQNYIDGDCILNIFECNLCLFTKLI